MSIYVEVVDVASEGENPTKWSYCSIKKNKFRRVVCLDLQISLGLKTCF